MDAILLTMHGGMSVPAENAVRAMHAGVEQGTGSHFGRKPQPASIQAVDRPGQWLSLKIKFLQLQIEPRPQIMEPHVIDAEPVKLVSVDRQMAEAGILPLVFLIHLHAHQVRHHVSQSLIMVPFHPHHFNVAFGIGKLANVAEKFPVFFGETAEIQVGKNVSQQDKPPKAVFLEDTRGPTGAAGFRSQMHVGEDQRVVWRPIHRHVHTKFVVEACYRKMKTAQILVHR